MPPRSFISRPELHGHRGCRGLRPENTLPAFRYALELGVDVLELDVVISADEQVVVSHEPWLSALICRDMAGNPIRPENERGYNLYQVPYALIRQCDCGLTQHPDFPEQQPEPTYKPLLHEVLTTADAYAQELGRPLPKFSIELKSSPAGDGQFHPKPARFVELVMAVVQAAGVTSRASLLSFDKRVLQAAQTQVLALPLCLLVEDSRSLAEHLYELGFVPDIYGPQHRLVDAYMVTDAHARGLRLVPWTVNEPSDMRRLLNLGVDGITTDYPDRFRSLLPQ